MLLYNQNFVQEAWRLIIKSLAEARSMYPNLDGLKYWNTIKPLLEDVDSRNNIDIIYNPLQVKSY